jgi:hypothetical protein
MGKVIVIFIALVASTSLLCGTEPSPPQPFAAGLYDVSLDFTTPLQATVHATLSVTDGQLFTVPNAGGHQWSSNIKHLRAFSSEGKEIRVAFVAPNHWRFSTLTNQSVQIAYDVDLSFTKPVAERTQGGQLFGDALYVINQALFVLSDALGERTVHFVVPASFKIASPLRQISPLTYTAPSDRELASNATVFEWFPRSPSTESAFDLGLVTPNSRATASALSCSSARHVAHGASRCVGSVSHRDASGSKQRSTFSASWPALLFCSWALAGLAAAALAGEADY